MKLELEFSFLKACIHFGVGGVLRDCSLPSWIRAVISKFTQQHCIYLSVCLSIIYIPAFLLSMYLSIYLPIYLPVCLSIHLCICRFICHLSMTSIYHLLNHPPIRIRDKHLKSKGGAASRPHFSFSPSSWFAPPQFPPPLLGWHHLTTQDGRERQGGDSFCFGRGKMRPGLGEASLDPLHSSRWGHKEGAPRGSLWDIFGAALSPFKRVSREVPVCLQACFSGNRKWACYLFELPVLYIV